MTEIPSEYRGWWRIVETSQWVRDGLDMLGPAVLSLPGHADRLRMYGLLAYVNCKPIKSGVSFTRKGVGPDERCLGMVERDEWDLAISMAGGNVVEAARQVGIEVPRGTRTLWGRSQEAALGAYRSWLKRKARKP